MSQDYLNGNIQKHIEYIYMMHKSDNFDTEFELNNLVVSLVLKDWNFELIRSDSVIQIKIHTVRNIIFNRYENSLKG